MKILSAIPPQASLLILCAVLIWSQLLVSSRCCIQLADMILEERQGHYLSLYAQCQISFPAIFPILSYIFFNSNVIHYKSIIPVLAAPKPQLNLNSKKLEVLLRQRRLSIATKQSCQEDLHCDLPHQKYHCKYYQNLRIWKSHCPDFGENFKE
jgi:hypothetical protein